MGVWVLSPKLPMCGPLSCQHRPAPAAMQSAYHRERFASPSWYPEWELHGVPIQVPVGRFDPSSGLLDSHQCLSVHQYLDGITNQREYAFVLISHHMDSTKIYMIGQVSFVIKTASIFTHPLCDLGLLWYCNRKWPLNDVATVVYELLWQNIKIYKVVPIPVLALVPGSALKNEGPWTRAIHDEQLGEYG